MGKAGDLHAQPFQMVGDVVRSRLALDGCIDGDDDLVNAAGLHAVDQAAYIEILGADPVERR
ncbi:hypothetical protein D3C72_2520700 [compost metagenome]